MNDERGKSIIDHSIFIYQLCWFIYEWAITYVYSCMYGKNRMVNLLCLFISYSVNDIIIKVVALALSNAPEANGMQQLFLPIKFLCFIRQLAFVVNPMY